MPTYSPSNPWAGTSLGSVERWMAHFERTITNAENLYHIRLLVEAVYRVAPVIGLGAHKVMGQFVHETANATSDAWIICKNPAGIGVTDDSKRLWHDFKDGTTAGLALLVHVSLYVFGRLHAILDAHRTKDPRADAIPKDILGQRKTLESFGGSRTGFITWAADADYGTKVANLLNRLEPVFAGDPVPTPTAPPITPKTEPVPPAETTDMSHRFILSAGHRNENRGGAIKEIEWTYPMTQMLRDAIVRRGGKAWIVQEHDGDNDPTFSRGRGLQSAATRCVELAKTFGPFDSYISCHYEGSPARGFFGIHPDAAGDSKAMNTIDVALCEKMAKHVAKTGMPARKLHGHHIAGVMSERETGVGAQGYRLGEFYGTLGFRERTARVIIEAGSYPVAADRAMLWDWNWVRRYCDALVDALEEQFGTFGGATQPTVPTAPATGSPFTFQTDLPVRRAPGFGEAIVTWLERGTKGTLVIPPPGEANPVKAQGIDWYDVEVPGFGTGFVPGTIMKTLKIG